MYTSLQNNNVKSITYVDVKRIKKKRKREKEREKEKGKLRILFIIE